MRLFALSWLLMKPLTVWKATIYNMKMFHTVSVLVQHIRSLQRTLMGGDRSNVMDIPKTLKQALGHENAEFWGEAIMDEA